jgi:hypothetical protein
MTVPPDTEWISRGYIGLHPQPTRGDLLAGSAETAGRVTVAARLAVTRRGCYRC